MPRAIHQSSPLSTLCVAALLFLTPLAVRPARADEPSVALVVDAGRPLRVALDQRLRVRKVGQVVSGTLVDPVYCRDRVVLPAGLHVLGHIERLVGVRGWRRALAAVQGDFTPSRQVVLSFDALVTVDGTRIALKTAVGPGSENVSSAVATERGGNVHRVEAALATQVDTTFAPLRGPGKRERAKDWLWGTDPKSVHDRLPSFARRPRGVVP
jgi:hypothetical protein